MEDADPIPTLERRASHLAMKLGERDDKYSVRSQYDKREIEALRAAVRALRMLDATESPRDVLEELLVAALRHLKHCDTGDDERLAIAIDAAEDLLVQL